jgi:hypothetical protein
MTTPQTTIYSFQGSFTGTWGSTPVVFQWNPDTNSSSPTDPVPKEQYTITFNQARSTFIITNLNPTKKLTGTMFIQWSYTTPNASSVADYVNFQIRGVNNVGIYNNVTASVPLGIGRNYVSGTQQTLHFSMPAFSSTNPLEFTPTTYDEFNNNAFGNLNFTTSGTPYTYCVITITQ